MDGLTIRDSTAADIPAIRRIYAHHVLHGTASFEEEPPDEAELARRRDELVRRGFPHLVAVQDGAVRGYAYAGPYRTRAAYRYTVENSVYVEAALARRGIGAALLAALIARCEAGGWRQMVAIIGDSANRPSIALHERAGFRLVGTLRGVGCKFGRTLDTVLMQRALGDGAAAP